MDEAIRFFRAVEAWVYLFLGFVGLIFIRRFILAWQELRGAVFGLERERAQGRLNQAASVLVLLLAMTVTEFILVSFIAPALPEAIPLPTATLNLLATPTTTLPATTPQPGAPEGFTQPTAVAATPLPGCVPGQIEILTPPNGQEVSGVVEVTGTANLPNFGFYKFEIKRPDDTIWLTIQAGNSIVIAGKLGDWDTSRLTPGEYELGLVVVDNAAQASPPCVIRVLVMPAPEASPGP
ncbi:MAG: hypothetical protein AB1894_00830 [Chloroflexota bacterium]